MTKLAPSAVPVISRRLVFLYLALALITFSVYFPVAHHQFVNYDDTDFVSGNPIVQKGLTVEGFKWIWHSEVARNWHPITMLTHMLDCQFFGLRPGPPHLVNVILHVFNTLLLFHVLRLMTGFLWRSAFIAGLFALHPLHVESVAWLAERKDVLSTFFWFLTLWMYICYVRALGTKGGWSGLIYTFSVFSFALGLMSKPMLVTGPFVLWLIDYWPLGRLKPSRQRNFSRLIWEKIPFFALSLALCVVTYSIQKQGGAMLMTTNLPISARIANALISYVRYIGHMFWPMDLTALYLHSGGWPAWEVALSALVLAVITVVAITQRTLRPWFAVGWFWYLGMLIPVIGLVQVGMQSMADRFTYVPLIGLFIIVTWAAAEFCQKRQWATRLAPATGCVVLIACGTLTWHQLDYWRDSETLFSRMLDVNKNNYMAHFNLANLYAREKVYAAAESHYQAAITAEPNYADAQNNFGGLLLEQKRYDEAIQHYREAARINPQYFYYFNLANALADAASARHDANEFAEAISTYEHALQLNPNSSETHHNLGLTWQAQGNDAEAIAEFREAIRLKPDFDAAHFSLGNAFMHSKQLGSAEPEFLAAEQINPSDPDYCNALGMCYAMQNKMPEAEAQLKRLLQLQPGNQAAYGNLGNVLSSEHKMDEAIQSYSAALRLNPRDYQTEFNLGLTYSIEGKRDEAAIHFKQALAINPNDKQAEAALQSLDKAK